MSHSSKSAGSGAASGNAAFNDTASADQGDAAPLFAPFEDARAQAVAEIDLPGRYFASLATRTKDIAMGLATVAQLLEDNELRKEDADTPPLLNGYHAGALLRMSIVMLDMLGDHAEQRLDDAYDRCTPEGIAEAARRAGVVKQ